MSGLKEVTFTSVDSGVQLSLEHLTEGEKITGEEMAGSNAPVQL